METPAYLESRVAEIVAMEADRADKQRLWAVVLKLAIHRDGDQYCILWGENLQTGVAGFGDSPVDAIQAFEHEMCKSIKKTRKLERIAFEDGSTWTFDAEEETPCATTTSAEPSTSGNR